MMIMETKMKQVPQTATNTEPTMHEGEITILGTEAQVEFFINQALEMFQQISRSNWGMTTVSTGDTGKDGETI